MRGTPLARCSGTKYETQVQKAVYKKYPELNPDKKDKDTKKEADSKEEIVMGKNWKVEGGDASASCKMLTYRAIDGSDIQVQDVIHKELSAVKAAHDEAENALASVKAELAALKASRGSGPDKMALDAKDAEISALKAQAEARKQEFDSMLNAAVLERVEVMEQAKLFGVDCANKTSEKIKREIISSSSIGVDGASLKDVEVNAYYKASIGLKKKEADEFSGLSVKKDSSASFDENEARDNMTFYFKNKKRGQANV